MLLLKIDEEDFVDLLDERVGHWTSDPVVADLFHDMYWANYVDNAYDGMEIEGTIAEIVDNDYVNYCDVIEEDDYRYEDVDAAFKNGEYETDHGYIEAEEDGKYLIRVY